MGKANQHLLIRIFAHLAKAACVRPGGSRPLLSYLWKVIYHTILNTPVTATSAAIILNKAKPLKGSKAKLSMSVI